MQGFNPEFQDLNDYILKITENIWERRQVARIREWYGAQAPVYTPMGVSRDVEEVVKFTLQTLHMFPDRQLLGEEVVASEPEPGRYYSSHRILSPMTHSGDGFFGLPSGRRVQARIIADCVCEQNQVVEEWMVRDQAAIIEQIGLDVSSFARQLAQAERAQGVTPASAEQLVQRWQGGPASLPVADAQLEQLLHDYGQLWEQGGVDQVQLLYNRAANLEAPGGTSLYGHDQISAYYLSYLASLQQRRWRLEHVSVAPADDGPLRVALRWSLTGKHSGFGYLGEPSDKTLVLLGISHWELRSGVIMRDFLLLDELALWLQIHS